jgi:hypothetical protein
MTDKKIIEYYWILFIKSKTFWHKFFYGTYAHISLLKNDGFNWIHIDPRSNNLNINILPFEGDASINQIAKYFNVDMDAVKVFISPCDKKFKLKKTLIPRFITCVSAIKYILGMKVGGFFPDKFFKNLIKISEKDQSHRKVLVSYESFYKYRSK